MNLDKPINKKESMTKWKKPKKLKKQEPFTNPIQIPSISLSPNPSPNLNSNPAVPTNLTTAPLQSLFNSQYNNFTQFFKDKTQDKTQDKQSTQENMENKKNQNSPPLQEGFDCRSLGEAFAPIAKYIDFLFFWLIDKCLIEYPTVFIDYVGESLCELAADKPPDNTCAEPKINNKDKEIIKNQFKTFLSILISCYIVYNWYYVMFYTSIFNSRVEVMPIDTKTLNNYNSTIGFIFNYLIAPVSLLNSIMISSVPNSINSITSNLQIKLILLFLIMVAITRNYGAEIMLSFSKFLKRESTSHTGMMSGIMILFGMTAIFRVIDSIRQAFNNWDIPKLFDLYTNPMAEEKVELYKFATPVTILFILISFIFRITLSIAVIWIAGLFVTLYILLMSFFAIFIYGPMTIGKINDFIFSRSPKSIPATLSEAIQNEEILPWIMNTIYVYIFEIVFIIFFLKGITQYSTQIKTESLKMMMIGLSCMCILVATIIIYFRNLTYMDEEKDISEKGKRNANANAMNSTVDIAVSAVNSIVDTPNT